MKKMREEKKLRKSLFGGRKHKFTRKQGHRHKLTPRHSKHAPFYPNPATLDDI